MDKHTYPNQDLVLDLVSKATASELGSSNAEHPEDITVMASFVANTVGFVLSYLHNNDYLGPRAYDVDPEKY